MLIIRVNREVVLKRIIEKNGGPRWRRGTRGKKCCLTKCLSSGNSVPQEMGSRPDLKRLNVDEGGQVVKRVLRSQLAMPEDGRPRQHQLIADQAVRNGSGT
jgi:hypothetical protein